MYNNVIVYRLALRDEWERIMKIVSVEEMKSIEADADAHGLSLLP